MTEEAPAAATMPACNGSVPSEDRPLQVIGGIEEMAKSVGTVPYANAESSPDTSPEKENPEENRNSPAEDIVPESFAGEKRCQEKREESAGTLQQGAADLQDTGSSARAPGEGPGGTAGPAPGSEAEQSAPGSAEPGGKAAGEEEEEEAEEDTEDTEEDEVQVVEMKKENSSEASRPQQRDSARPASPPASPACRSPPGKAAPPPGLGKKNDISRHSYSRYNTISYRRIRKGNTKQRIDEFESMMHL